MAGAGALGALAEDDGELLDGDGEVLDGLAVDEGAAREVGVLGALEGGQGLGGGAVWAEVEATQGVAQGL